MVLYLIVYQLAVVFASFRIECIKALHYTLCMPMVIGKDDCLANILTAMYLLTIGHQFRKYIVNRIIIDKVAEYLVPFYVSMVLLILWNALQCLLVFPHLFQFCTLFLAEFIILDASVYHLRSTVLQFVWTEETISNGFIVCVFKVWFIFQLQQFEGVLVYLIAWSSRETYQE